MNKEDFKKIAYPETYADEIKLHNIFTYMRKEDPVTWVEPDQYRPCLLYTSPSPRDQRGSRIPSSA